MIVRFDSLSHVLEEARDVSGRMDHSRSWDLGVSAEDARRLAVRGDLTIAARAEALLGRVEPVYTEGQAIGWRPALVGPIVDVPAFLSGDPFSMRARRPRDMACRTVRVYVDVVSSCTLTGAQLLQRGVSILALMESLQRNRIDVELHLVCSMSRRSGREPLTYVIPIESKPLDLSVAGFVLAHPAWPRNVLYQHGDRYDRHSLLCPGFIKTRDQPKTYDRWARKHLDLEPTDVYVPLAYGGDELVITDPQEWVQQRVSQILTEGKT